MAPQRKRSGGRNKQRGGDSDLPMSLDVLFDVLLPFPSKELCRLRLVCRSWRSLLSDKDFIAAHARRHPHEKSLIVVGHVKRRFKDSYPPDNILCDIMDLSGRVVRRIRSTGDGIRNESMVFADADLIGIAHVLTYKGFRLLHPLTGAQYPLPDSLAEEHLAYRHHICPSQTRFVFGLVSSTGEHKVLPVLYSSPYNDVNNKPSQLCEVFTLGSSRCDTHHQIWRGKKGPPYRLLHTRNVVIDSVVYFSLDEPDEDQDVASDYVASFDLETEEWRPTLRGPISSLAANGGATGSFFLENFSVASLNGCLVVVEREADITLVNHSINLWFLIDLEKCLWVKQHSIQVEDHYPYLFWKAIVRPLLVLDDDRILLLYKEDDYKEDDRGFIRIYDPKTNTCTDMAEIKRCAKLVCAQ